MTRLELWLHTPTGNRYIVLSTEAGPQIAAGPLDTTDLQAAQQDESTIAWMPGVADWIQKRLEEFETVWPQQPTPAEHFA